MKKWLFSSTVLLMATPTFAIVVQNYSVATNVPAGSWDLNWDYVYNYKNSSSVAVGNRWILTAAHVADDGGNGSLTIGGVTYNQQERIFHDDADVALVRYDKDLPGHYSLYSGGFSTSTEIIMVGFGNTGSVFNAPGPNDFYLDSGSGRGIRRWGTQKYDNSETYVYDAGSGNKTNDGFWMGFSLGDTAYEAGVGIYDSGGGSFVDDAGTWKLAGINTARDVNLSQTGYNRNFAISMPAYLDWIESITIGTNDFDGDGLPNYWEQQYGSVTGVVASADQDGDGLTGEQEYTADTDPTDETSFFKIDSFVALTNQTVTFDGSTARQYQVFYTTNDLADAGLTWSAAHSNLVWGTGTNSSITVTNGADKAFYRLKVSLP